MKVKLCQAVCGEVGQVVDRDEKYAKWLITNGYAVSAESDSTSQSANTSNTKSEKTSSKAKTSSSHTK